MISYLAGQRFLSWQIDRPVVVVLPSWYTDRCRQGLTDGTLPYLCNPCIGYGPAVRTGEPSNMHREQTATVLLVRLPYDTQLIYEKNGLVAGGWS